MAALFGRYQLLKRIAVGGMGEVFLARRGDVTVVIKRLLPHLANDVGAQARFRDEARLASQVRHPNLVKVLELGQVEGQWFLVMEYVRGESLHQRMTEGRFGLDQTLRIVADLAGALSAVHSARDASGQALHAVHRDVTPRNVIIDEAGVVKLIDFGVSAVRGGGTLEYAAPEEEPDHRADQYSLGIIFWELLSGRGLFHADSDAQTVELIEAGLIARPPPSVSDEIVEVVMRMLARDPAARFSSCDEVRLTVHELLEPPTAPLAASRVVVRFERPTTSFIGRARELADLERLVEQGATRIAIVGRSGLGKTRVALELIERVGPRLEVITALEAPVQSDLTLYRLPPLSQADGEALYLERSGGKVSPARALDGLALTVELLAGSGTAEALDLPRAFEVAWLRLEPRARRMLEALAATPSSFSLEQVEHLAPDGLEVLEVLRDTSLLQVLDIGAGELRFSLHPANRALTLLIT